MYKGNDTVNPTFPTHTNIFVSVTEPLLGKGHILFLYNCNTTQTMFVGPCHHSMASTQVADGGTASDMGGVAANKLNKQSRTADKGWSSSLGVEGGANHASP